MATDRRTVLASSGPVLAALSGCVGILSGEGPTVDLVFVNYTAERQPLKLELLRTDASAYDDALAYEGSFEVPPPDGAGSAGVLRETDVVRERRYLLRVLLRNGRGQWHHHHYYPGESTSDPDSAELLVRVYRDERTERLYVRFG